MAIQLASSSSYRSKWSYDVFLSFRGEDTRNNFTSHLYNALHQRGINTFIDDSELKRGEEISPALLEAIKESRISLVIFSKNYAASSWCLDELVHIIECKETKGQMVWPIFYQVDPSEVRNQKGRFAKAFAKNVDVNRHSEERIQRWRTALNKAANLCGWHLGDESEASFVERIVEGVWSKLNRVYLNVADHPVGIETRVQELKFLSDRDLSNVHIVGIHGTGGIGKTTIAKAHYNVIADQFEGCSFLANVRERSKQCEGLVKLQEALLSEILQSKEIKIHNSSSGINLIKERLCYKRVLLVLYDLDNVEQLKSLAGERNWFGSGSRIIVTTRDEHLLVEYGVDKDSIYRVKGLDYSDSLKLLCWNAFKKDNPSEGFEEFSENLIHYSQGLPLALIVLGSFLCGRSKAEWKDTLSELEKFPQEAIYKVLKISFDGLNDREKAIFLDIACFFNGKNIDQVKKFLDSCDFYPEKGIKVLVERALLTFDHYERCIIMHHIIQDMGREIVHRESPNDLGQRSRLWFHEDILQVLEENAESNKVEGIKLILSEPEEVQFTPKSFEKMKSLRILIINNAQCSGDHLEYLPNKLRWLEWSGYPFSSLPVNFSPKKLVVFDVPNSRLKLSHPVSWFKDFKGLKYMNLHNCEFLTEVPNVSSCHSLEHLKVSNCRNLTEVHESVGNLDKLCVLDLHCCSNIVSLPRSFKLKSLESLHLDGCTRLKEFPEIIDNMDCLRFIGLARTGIVELPSSIERITGLESLSMDDCQNLTNLPSSIYKLQKLRELVLGNCSKLGKFPIFSHKKRKFTSLNERSSSTGSASILNLFPSLEILEVKNCNLSDVNFLTYTEHFPALSILCLGDNNITAIPACLPKLAKLKRLYVRNCRLLQEIPELPASMWVLDADGCESLQRWSQLESMLRDNGPAWIIFADCYKLIETHGDQLMSILRPEGFVRRRKLIVIPGSAIPKWFSHKSTKSSISFQAPVDTSTDMIALVVGICGRITPFEIQVFINGKRVSINGEWFYRQHLNNFMESDNLLLAYIPKIFLPSSREDYIDLEVKVLDIHSDEMRALKALGVYLMEG